jgi:nucleotide-binding universal stress UspA family protein
VLVVHGGAAAVPGPKRVVVGVDGSARSRAALAAAVREAGARGADLDVLVAFELTDHWTDLGSVVVPPLEEIHADLHRRAEDLVQAVLGEQEPSDATPRPHIRVVVAQGPADTVLVHHGQGAELLVVGSRGHGEFRGLLLGSVALSTAMRASCPVLVVHPQGAPSAGEDTRREAAAVGG